MMTDLHNSPTQMTIRTRDHAADRPKLDNFDRRILAMLQQRGDLGPGELSAHVNLSPSQCSRRLQRLKSEGYVLTTVALLDPARLNLAITAYVLVRLRSHAIECWERFRERVLALPEVTSCEVLAGDNDYLLRVSTRDLATYQQFLQAKIHSAPEIETVRSSILLESLKSTTSLTLDYC